MSYSKEGNKWYCHNDSSCKEVQEDNIDKSNAYFLIYETTEFLPDKANMQQDSGDLDDEFELDFKKQCSIMWLNTSAFFKLENCFLWNNALQNTEQYIFLFGGMLINQIVQENTE